MRSSNRLTSWTFSKADFLEKFGFTVAPTIVSTDYGNEQMLLKTLSCVAYRALLSAALFPLMNLFITVAERGEEVYLHCK